MFCERYTLPPWYVLIYTRSMEPNLAESTTITRISDAALADLPIDTILWATLGLTLIVFAVYSFILLWHWKEYGTGKFTTLANMFIYLGVSGGCLVLMVLGATWYSFI